MALSPMMQHYMQIKEKHKEAIVFYRLGDFYEMFFEDAELVSKLLGITLTGRDCGLENRAPMCGVPFHSADTYIARLISMGHKVAICEQMTAPKPGEMVERDVVKIITPGTIMEENILTVQNNFIASVFSENENSVGLAWLDLSTGEFHMTQLDGKNAWNILNDNLVTLRPSEIISNKYAFLKSAELISVRTENVPRFYNFLDFAFEHSNASQALLSQLKIGSLSVLNSSDKPAGVCAAGALLEYIKQTQKRSLTHINRLQVESDGKFMYLDSTARLNLELTETIFERKRHGSLIWVLDQTQTAMGRRALVNWLDRPLLDESEINDRLDAVEELLAHNLERDQLSELLKTVSDVERICGRVSYGNVGPKSCVDIQKSLEKFPKVKKILQKFSSNLLKKADKNIADFGKLQKLLQNALIEDAPVHAKEGNFIRDGFNAELDNFRHAKTEGNGWLMELESKERELTGIKSLKIKFNNILGYYFDVPLSQLEKVPFRFERRQTLSTSERYSSADLRKLQELLVNAEENMTRLEQELFVQLKEEIKKHIQPLQEASQEVATLDVLISFAKVALKNRYVRPTINSKIKNLKIEEGRHPVVEKISKERFVPNSTLLEPSCRTMIITGPNMSGKSTYMRQVALITIMAHMGCFVPAVSAEISICDRVFTRIGATDNLGMGQSTFMVEMVEVANIIHNATDKSLLILDEIGRGTSTVDGLSIAWAVLEYITKKIKANTFFSTHYHEITAIEAQLEGVRNFQVAVKEYNNSIIFLHNIVPGSADKSFGIEVANLAGIDKEIVQRAREILHQHEEAEYRFSGLAEPCKPEGKKVRRGAEEVISELEKLNPNHLTPLEAIAKLMELKERLKE